jgi:hypothetical protein
MVGMEVGCIVNTYRELERDKIPTGHYYIMGFLDFHVPYRKLFSAL